MGSSLDWTTSTSCEYLFLRFPPPLLLLAPLFWSLWPGLSLILGFSLLFFKNRQSEKEEWVLSFFSYPEVSHQISIHSSLPAKFRQSNVRPQSLRYQSPQDPTLHLAGKCLHRAMTSRAPLPLLQVHETLKVILYLLHPLLSQASIFPVQFGFHLRISLFCCSFIAKLCSLCCK